MTRALHNTVVPQTCGVGVSGIFRKAPAGHVDHEIAAMPNSGGAGWHMASFTNDPGLGNTYKDAYKELRERWQIEYQSKVRINVRTGHKFFFCVYDTKKVNIDNSAFLYPTKGLSV